MKVLVATTLFLGDVIVSMPLIQRIKDEYPDASVDVLVAKGCEEVLEHQPAIRKVITYDKAGKDNGLSGIFAVAGRLRSEKYEMAFILPGSVRTAIAVYLARIPRRIGTDQSTGIDLFLDRVKFPDEAKKIQGGKILFSLDNVWHVFRKNDSFTSLFFTDVVKLNSNFSSIERNLQLLEPLGVKGRSQQKYVPLQLSGEHQAKSEKWFSESNAKTLIAIAPGTSWKTKQWPASSFVDVIKQLVEKKINVVLMGGAGDKEVCEKIFKDVGSSNVENVCGKFSVLESAALLQKCKLLLTNDSAAMHIAAAMDVSTITIMGPTIPAFGYAPVGPKHTVVQVNDLWCRPCTPFGGEKCPTGTFHCTNRIEPDEVVSIVMKKVTE